MQRALLGIILGTIILSACTQRTVCPAFQSAYIYDQNELRKKFSYFLEDSTPKIYSASKTKYLIAEPVSYRKKIRSMKTLAMKPVNVAVPDSLLPNYDENLGKDGDDGVVPGAELDEAARSVIDSTYIVDVPPAEETASVEDSVYMISKDRELRLLKYNFPDSLKQDPASGKFVSETPYYAVVNITFNVEQDNYMWYLRDYLVLPDVRIAAHKSKDGDEAEGDGSKGTSAKKKKGGFFKNLFRKKKQEAPAEEEAPPPPNTGEDEFDYIDEDEQGQPPVAEEEQPKEEKKGLLGRKKDKKEKKEKKPKKEKPKKSEEDQQENQKPEEDPADKIPEKVDEDGF